MSSEQKTCQNCRQAFQIQTEDFDFYEKIKVPPPTWCPACRRLRRMGWMGYRILYKRKCDFSGEDMITFYHPDAPYKLYKQEIWWSDRWDPKEYGRDYDFSRPFFEQFDELLKTVPLPSLNNEYTTLVNSDYCNATGSLKNSYLVFQSGSGGANLGHENTAYMHMVDDTRDSLDLSFSGQCELCYEDIRCFNCFRVQYSMACEECRDLYLCWDCVGCSNCFGCINLKNASYCIFNEQYSKEDYEKKLKEFNLNSRSGREAAMKKFQEFIKSQPRKAFRGRRNENVSGDYVSNSRNVHDCYLVRDGENLRYVELMDAPNIKDSYDYSCFGVNAELIYESAWVGLNVRALKFCFWNYHAHDLEYCFGCHGSENLFGCVGLRKSSYCIFNKQCSKEEYEALVPKIKEQMMRLPYRDALGRKYGYGEFFPPEISPWTFNESMASFTGLLPLSKEEAIAQGFKWRDDHKKYPDTTAVSPDRIGEVADEFTKEIIKCATCAKNFQIIPMELSFYRRLEIPVPLHCPLCRDKARIAQLNPMEVYDRNCSKCSKAIQTSYAPERSEIVYCEECYQQEIS